MNNIDYVNKDLQEILPDMPFYKHRRGCVLRCKILRLFSEPHSMYGIVHFAIVEYDGRVEYTDLPDNTKNVKVGDSVNIFLKDHGRCWRHLGKELRYELMLNIKRPPVIYSRTF